MSDFALQLGDLATRLGRSLGITGRIPTSLRDPVLPVSVVSNSTGVPYADEPKYFRSAGTVITAGATKAFQALIGVAPRTVVTNAYIDASQNVGPYAPCFLFRPIGGVVQTPGFGFALNVPGSVAVKAQASSASGADISVVTGAGQTPLVVQQLSVQRGIDLIPLIGPVVLFPGDAFILQFQNGVISFNWGLTWAEYVR